MRSISRLRIKSVGLHRVRVPFVEPFRISNGVVAEKDAILIELTTADGVVGWGEASPMSGSFYSADTPDSSWSRAQGPSLIPALFQLARFDPTRRSTGSCGNLRRIRLPKQASKERCGMPMRTRDKWPLCELFGIERRPVPSGVAIGIFDTIDELIERVRRYVAEGYQRVKIKIQPGWDVEPVAAVRATFPELPLMVDANAAYTIDDLEYFRELDRFELMMIEQPLARPQSPKLANLQAQLKTPLCADESAESLTAWTS